MRQPARTLAAAMLAGAGVLALISVAPQAMEVKQAQAAVPEGDPSKEATLKALTDQVVNHLTRMRGGEKGNRLSTPADLQAALNALVEKATSEGRTSTDILKLIDEALQERGGSLQDVLATTDGRGLLQQLVARAGSATKADDPYTRMLTQEGNATVLAEEAAGEGGGRTVVVKRGDTLTTLAEKHYGTMTAWRKIFTANKAVLKDPNFIPVGVRLRLP